MPTDTELLDFLQQLTDKSEYTGKAILRDSSSGRGWRFHESSLPDATKNIREAITKYMKKKEEN